MEKFNLERALAGEPVCTRDGREVTQLTYFRETEDLFSVGAVLDKEVYLWQANGRFLQTKEDSKDLFIKPKENAIWINVYKNENGFLYTMGLDYSSEELAKKSADKDAYFKTIKIVE
jgi:hypothetical protein